MSMLTRQDFQEIVKLEGQVRGSALNTDAACIKSQEGREGLHRVEQRFRMLGYPLEYRHIKDMGWYPISLRVLSLCIMKDVFKLDDSDMKKMGDTAPKFSFIVKVFMKFTNLRDIALDNVPGYWRMHYSVGDMNVGEINENKGYVTVQLVDFNIHPILCAYFEGYFRRLLQFGFVDGHLDSEETKCIHRGDVSHEYRISWKK
ncbi:MAG: hypothetical protein JSV53_00910 [candidate division WOR-3 bacterium]|nr:MAG: hypothetical protein JSV53_00910 [candidate division WOR-3 bacterium]